jgi:hypothetical protein
VQFRTCIPILSPSYSSAEIDQRNPLINPMAADVQIIDDATAQEVLDLVGDKLDDGDIQVRQGVGGTLIGTISLAADAMSAASGTGGPGNRVKEFLNEPLDLTAVDDTADSATALIADCRNSGGTIIFRGSVGLAGSNSFLEITAPGHSSNPTVPNLVTGQSFPVQAGAQLTY